MSTLEELTDLTCSGIYVLSFNMEEPMVYHQPHPESDKLINNTMIKVGKCKNIRKRMGDYRSTYGYRDKEPPKTEDYWISRGYRDRYLKRCLGCERKDPHHHVEYLHIEPTPFVHEDSYQEFLNDIENRISNKFYENKIWSKMEYYQKDIKQKLIEQIIYLVKRNEEN